MMEGPGVRTCGNLEKLQQLDGETVKNILTEDLKIREIPTKIILKILTGEQNQWRLDNSSDLSSNADVFRRIITRVIMSQK